MNEKYQTMVCKKLKKLRKENNYTQKQIANFLKIDQGHLSNIENGHSIPSLEVFSDICIKLKITPDMLLLGVIRIDNIPENIKDNLKLCTNKELKLIDNMIQCILDNRDGGGDRE